MSDAFDPKFDVNEVYVVAEFIFRLETILAQTQEDSPSATLIRSLIDWANQHPLDTLISFTVDGDVIFPVATKSVRMPIFPKEDNQLLN